MKIKIDDNLVLCIEQNVTPYDKEIFIYTENNNGVVLQDIIRLSPDYIYGDNDEVIYSTNTLSLKVFEDKDNEDYTLDINIPLNNTLQEL